MPSRHLGTQFMLFTGLILAAFLWSRARDLRFPRIGPFAGSTRIVERIPAPEARKLGISYRN